MKQQIREWRVIFSTFSLTAGACRGPISPYTEGRLARTTATHIADHESVSPSHTVWNWKMEDILRWFRIKPTILKLEPQLTKGWFSVKMSSKLLKKCLTLKSQDFILVDFCTNTHTKSLFHHKNVPVCSFSIFFARSFCLASKYFPFPKPSRASLCFQKITFNIKAHTPDLRCSFHCGMIGISSHWTAVYFLHVFLIILN